MTKREGFEKRDIFSSGKLGERERFTKVSNGHQQESIALSFFRQPEQHVFSRMDESGSQIYRQLVVGIGLQNTAQDGVGCFEGGGEVGEGKGAGVREQGLRDGNSRKLLMLNFEF